MQSRGKEQQSQRTPTILIVFSTNRKGLPRTLHQEGTNAGKQNQCQLKKHHRLVELPYTQGNDNTALSGLVLCCLFQKNTFSARTKINSIFECLTGLKIPAYSILQMKFRSSVTETQPGSLQTSKMESIVIIVNN